MARYNPDPHGSTRWALGVLAERAHMNGWALRHVRATLRRATELRRQASADALAIMATHYPCPETGERRPILGAHAESPDLTAWVGA